MTWLGEVVEIVVQGFWEGVVEAAFAKWGWIGGALAVLAPFVIGGLALWMVLG